MMWLTWRQFRPQAYVAAGLLCLLAIVLAATGPHLVSLFDSAGLAKCGANCGLPATNFLSGLKSGGYSAIFYAGIAVLYLTPALIGVFWGAPLITREFESGTYRLAWNQSVTRGRWIVVKLTLIGLSALATAGLLSLMVSWWASPIDRALSLSQDSSFNRMSPLVFGARGAVPLGYAAFAFALGVTIGLLVRRTVPAMALTLAVVAGVQVLMPNLVRPHLITPAAISAPLNVRTAGLIIRATGPAPGLDSPGILTVHGNFPLPGAWVLSNQTVTPAGAPFSVQAPQACLSPNPQPCGNWLAAKHLRVLVRYQPASRFWPLQWRELGIYLILALMLGGACIWRVRRKRS